MKLVATSQRPGTAPDGLAIRNPGFDRDSPFPYSRVLSKSTLGMDEEHLQQRTDHLRHQLPSNYSLYPQQKHYLGNSACSLPTSPIAISALLGFFCTRDTV